MDSDSFTYTLTDNIGPATFTGTVRNIWRAGAGSYEAVLTEDDGVTAVGTIDLTVTQGGALSGNFNYYGKRTPFTGSFSIDGIADLHVARFGHPPFEISLAFYAVSDVPQLSGEIVADDFQEIQFGGSHGAGGDGGERSLAGRYTLVLPAPTDTAMPQGDGYVAGQVPHSGGVHFAGIAGDGHGTLRGNPTAPRWIDLVLCEGGSRIPRSGLGRSRRFMPPPNALNDCDGLFHWVVAPSTRRDITRRDLNRIFSRWGSRFGTPPAGEPWPALRDTGDKCHGEIDEFRWGRSLQPAGLREQRQDRDGR